MARRLGGVITRTTSALARDPSIDVHASGAGACFRARYKDLLSAGFRADSAQREAGEVLASVGDDLEDAAASGAGGMRRVMRALGFRGRVVRGAYVCGGVGSGKTVLTTALYECVPAGIPKRTAHFHAFMQDVHARLHAKQGKAVGTSKVAQVAHDIANESRVLMLDEVQITDISDALVVRALLDHLFASGVTLLATSNREPERLYERGIQYDLFQPVVPLIREHCRVHVMRATRDYRLLNDRSDTVVWFTDEDGGADALQREFDRLADGFPIREATVPVAGRLLQIPMAVAHKRICFFTFTELCDRPLADNDYIQLCNTYHTVLVANIPQIDPINMRNQSRRFRSFIDQAYRCKVKVIVNAEKSIDEIFVRPDDVTVTEEVFESTRVQSRLEEMSTQQYLESEWTPDQVTQQTAGQ